MVICEFIWDWIPEAWGYARSTTLLCALSNQPPSPVPPVSATSNPVQRPEARNQPRLFDNIRPARTPRDKRVARGGCGCGMASAKKGGVGWIVDCRAAIVSLCSTPPEQFILHEDVSRPCIEISTWGCAPKARSFRFSGTHLLERDRGADRPAGFGAAGFDVRATRVGAREPEHVRAESRAELGVSRDRAEWPRPSAELQKAAELQSLNM